MRVGCKLHLATIDLKDWQENASYIDTLCLPVYSLRFSEKQLDLNRGKEIEKIAHWVEEKLTGRMLLLPAISYADESDQVFQQYVQQVVSELKNSGFHYLVILTDQKLKLEDDSTLSILQIPTLEEPRTSEQLEELAKHFVEQIIDLWLKNT